MTDLPREGDDRPRPEIAGHGLDGPARRGDAPTYVDPIRVGRWNAARAFAPTYRPRPGERGPEDSSSAGSEPDSDPPVVVLPLSESDADGGEPAAPTSEPSPPAAPARDQDAILLFDSPAPDGSVDLRARRIARTVAASGWKHDDLERLLREREAGAMTTRVAMCTAQARLIVGFVHAPADVTIESKLIAVGRAPDNAVVVPHCTVDPHHARIFWTGKRFVIEDLGSVNGTKVGGRTLGRGDRVQLKPHTAIWFGGVPCLFLMRTLEPGAGAERPVRADLVLDQLVRAELISVYQARDFEADLAGDLPTIAARFVTLGIVTPEQWADAHAAAATIDLLGLAPPPPSGDLGAAILALLLAPWRLLRRVLTGRRRDSSDAPGGRRSAAPAPLPARVGSDVIRPEIARIVAEATDGRPPPGAVMP